MLVVGRRVDGELAGYTPRAYFPLSGLDPAKPHVVEVECTWEDGTVSKERTRFEFTVNPIPAEPEASSN